MVNIVDMEELLQQENQNKEAAEEGVHNVLGVIENQLENKKDFRLAKNDIEELLNKYPEYNQLIWSLTNIGPRPEWYQMTTQLVIKYKNQPAILKKFWEILLAYNPNPNPESYRTGVVGQVAAFYIFEKLGLNPRLATPHEDKSNRDRPGADLFIGEIPIQVKSKSHGSLVTVNRGSDKNKTNMIWISINPDNLDRVTGEPDPKVLEVVERKLAKLGIVPQYGIR